MLDASPPTDEAELEAFLEENSDPREEHEAADELDWFRERIRRVKAFLGNPKNTKDFSARFPDSTRLPVNFALAFSSERFPGGYLTLLRACDVLVDYLSLPEGADHDTVYETLSHGLRSVAEKMDAERRARLIAGILAYMSELQEDGRLYALPDQRLANVSRLLSEALQVSQKTRPSRNRPPLFASRQPDPTTNKLLTAMEWFDLHWRARVEAGEVTGDDLKHADPKFYATFASTLSKRGQKISDLFPPSPTRGRKPETDDERAARLRAGARERMRRSRAKRISPS